MKTYAVLFVVTALLTYLLTPLLLFVCKRFKWFDQPDTARKLHDRPIPRLGGVVIFTVFNIGLSLLFFRSNLITDFFRLHLEDVKYIMIPGICIFLIGLYDDIVGLSPKKKLFLQALAAVLLFQHGFRITEIANPFGDTIRVEYLSLPITVLWIVGITNAFNLIDGMDGLAAGIAFFVSVSTFAVSFAMNHQLVSIFSILIAGTTLGFLKYNFSPARIFMGDAGSYFLGFLLGAIAIQGSQKSSAIVSITIPLLLLGVPIIDTSLTIVRRFLDGTPILSADHGHIHHRLLKVVRSRRATVLILYFFTVLLGLLSFLVVIGGDKIVALISVGVGAAAVWGLKKLGYEEFEELWAYVSRILKFQRRVIANQILIRRISNEIELADSLDQVLSLTASALDGLDFDVAEIQISKLNGSGIQEFRWCWKQSQTGPSRNEELRSTWKIVVPLSNGNGFMGTLTMFSTLGKERPLFQVSALVDMFAVKLKESLAKFPEPEYQAHFTGSPDVPSGANVTPLEAARRSFQTK
jgi:UDP-GlcNAc:undecaprenyl-phosphate GlcNAc-1-phosphate transferase